MKKISILIFCIMMIIAVRAQIPNSSFEFWTNGPNSAPDGWGTGDSGVVQRSTDHVVGNYSVKLQTTIQSPDTFRGQIQTGPAILDTGSGPHPVFPVNQRHSSFKGYYKYMPVNGDSADFGCMLFKTGFNSGFPGAPAGMLGIAFGTFGGEVSTFTPFSINFMYLDTSNLVPDSGWAILSSFVFFRGTNSNLIPLGNSVVYVDALSFDTYATGINDLYEVTTSFSLMPNPVNEKFELKFQLKESGYFTLKIYDMDGREIRKLDAANFTTGFYEQSYDVSGLANGEYLLVLGGENGFHSEKLIVIK